MTTIDPAEKRKGERRLVASLLARINYPEPWKEKIDEIFEEMDKLFLEQFLSTLPKELADRFDNYYYPMIKPDQISQSVKDDFMNKLSSIPFLRPTSLNGLGVSGNTGV